MPVLPFGEYRPDASDLNGGHSQNVNNVLPRADGYGPMKLPTPFTGALSAVCRGYFYARKTDGSVTIFAGTATRLYKLDNTTLLWSDVSNGATDYASLSSDANWQFAQFNNKVIAVQANEVPQVFDIVSDSAFSDLGGTPPRAAYIAIVNRFVVLSGLTSNPNRVQWSGLNAITTWTSGTTYSDYQDLPDGGNVKGVVGGEFGIIVQDIAVRRMTFAPGADIIFQIDRIAKDIGATAPYSIVDANGIVMFLSTKGFVKVTSNGAITPIGAERVDRMFRESYDETNPQLIIGVADPVANVVLWAYKELAFSPTRFNKILAYNWVLDRWSPIDQEGEYLSSLAQPGITLEGLGTIGQVSISAVADNGSGLYRVTVADTSAWSTGEIKYIGGATGSTDIIGEWTITVVDSTNVDLQGSAFISSAVSGAANNGSGLIRLTVADTTGMATGETWTVAGVTGTTEANGNWVITVIDGTHVDLQGSTFANAYVSGGSVAQYYGGSGYFEGSIDDLDISLDDITAATLPKVSVCDANHKVGFFAGNNMEATLDAAEQSGISKRLFIRGGYPVTDASSAYLSIGKRENLQSAATYSTETALNGQGFCPSRVSTRHARARLRIPEAATWTFATGIEPDYTQEGKR